MSETEVERASSVGKLAGLEERKRQMANIRDYLKRKEKRDEEQTKPRISYKEKIKSHKFTVFLPYVSGACTAHGSGSCASDTMAE